MKELELAALLCSRVCHDLISPVGAMANGVEVLADEDDEELKDSALKLIGSSAAQASAKLQYARLAYGSASSQGGSIDTRDAEYVVRELFKSLKAGLEWRLAPRIADKNEVKLLLNLILIATEAAPRGGTITVEGPMPAPGSAGTLAIRAEGPHARLRDEVAGLLVGAQSEEALDPRTVQPYVAALLAAHLGQRIEVAREEGCVTIATAPLPRPAPDERRFFSF
ncbi:MAG: histidine phosphotransferase [Alphaproteobacteria bacterium]|nr:histidine phosphotransferase [Alphaproteobacteria bacterium]